MISTVIKCPHCDKPYTPIPECDLCASLAPLSIDDARYSTRMDAIHTGQTRLLFPSSIACTHLRHFAVGEAMYATLQQRIHIVICGCAKKQMRWTDTKRSIAVMTYKKTIWDSPVVQFVGQPMDIDHSTDGGSNRQPAITAGIRIPCPQPAVLSFVNFVPEALRQRRRTVMAFNIAPHQIAPIDRSILSTPTSTQCGRNVLSRVIVASIVPSDIPPGSAATVISIDRYATATLTGNMRDSVSKH